MSDGVALVLALAVLAAALTAAVARPPWLPEAIAAAAGAAVLVVVGAVEPDRAGDALRELGPTVAFLACLLLIADGCRREGLFEALGALMARGSRGSSTRLLAFVFAIATAVTAVLSLDATIVLLTPVVFATATRLRTSPRPHVYACSHLANSASLLLPVSNLTNLLAFHASGLSFARFAHGAADRGRRGRRVARTAALLRIELMRPRREPSPPARARLPRLPLVVLALMLAGFALSSPVGIKEVWVAAAGATALTLPALARRTTGPTRLARAVEPGFLVFVLGLGVIVEAASDNGLAEAVRVLLPAGDTLPDLLAIAALANLVNNLPATLIFVPVAATGGSGPVLAVLIG